MKVNDGNTPIQMDAYVRQYQQNRQNSQKVQQQAGAPAPGDKVDLSSAAKEVQHAVRHMEDTGVVNEKKVQEVKMEVEAGTYKVDGARVATSMLKESFENDLILKKINTRA